MAAKNITKLKHRFPLRQIRQIPKLLRRTWPALTLCLLTLIIAFLNYEPGTILLGWDNLSSDLAPALNLKRALFAVWEEYQSLGLLGGMGHAADLPRVTLIYLFSLIPGVPLIVIRYLFSFLPLVLGPLGTYYFLYHRLFKTHLDSRTTQFASFLGSLFYLLNLATMQTFFTPFESFIFFYGAFPWLLHFLTGYLERPDFCSLIALFIVSFISAPSFYVETLFVVFCLLLIPIFSEVFFSPKNKINSFIKISKTFFTLIIPHLFWLLPVIFFVFTNGHVGEQSKINLISSPETYYRNLQFGNLLDIALLKGYFFNFLDLSGLGKFDYLLSVWRNHLSFPIITIIGYLLFIIVGIGCYYSVTKKFFWTKSLLGILALCLFFLLGGGLLINSAIPLAGELFRSPFTKFSTPLSFAFACFFAVGCVFILDLFSYLHHRLTYPITLFSVAFSLIIFMSPVFSGHLIDSHMRLSLPSEYTELFSYLKTQDPTTRIANFPQYTFWGWNYYDWGYRGSGFLWYGIRQPILDRAFDVWEKSSETYFEEISTALFSNNLESFEGLLDKYAVSWVLLDKHVIAPDSKADTGNANLEKFLSSSSKFTLDKSFGDKIFLYKKVDLKAKPQNFLSLENWNLKIQNYIYPFSSLSLRPTTDWIEKGGHLSTTVPLQPSVILSEAEGSHSSYLLSIPSLTATEKLLPVRLEFQKSSGTLTLRLTPITPTLFVGERQLDLQASPTIIQIPITPSANNFILQLDHQYWPLRIPDEVPDLADFLPLATTYLPTQNNFQINLFDAGSTTSVDLFDSLSLSDPAQCYLQKPNRKIEKIVTADSLSLLGTDVVGCLSAPLPLIPAGSLISLSFVYSSSTLTAGSVNISGRDYNAQEMPQPLEPKATPRLAQFFTNSTGGYQQANLILEASGTRSVQEITYRDLTLSTHQLLFSGLSKIKEIPKQETDLVGNENDLQISLPISNSVFDIRQTFDSNGFFPENRNCDQFNQGHTVKIVSKDGFLYQSQNAIECDYLNLRHLPHALNYLLSFKSESQKGLPLTVCLENQATYRCDIYERLIRSGLSQSIIQPIANSDEIPGYTLHLFNQSFGSRPTSNLLKEFSLRPVPLNFMKNIALSTSEISLVKGRNGAAERDSELSSTHPAEFLYTLTITNENSKIENFPQLSLYQTKSPYWQAIEVTQGDLKLPSWLLTAKIFFTYPSLTKLPHTDDNLWHNSWTLSSSQTSPVGAIHESPTTVSLVIIYLPQYLEFIGLLFLFTPPVIFFFLKIFPKSRK